MKIAGAVALVTGASSGIGAETARELARRGARVILAARRADLLAEQIAAIQAAGGQASAVVADLADAASIERLARDAEAVHGQVDILVNNAGVHIRGPFAAMAPESIDQMLDTNLGGAIQLTRLLLPAMLQRRGGAVVYVASVAGHIATDPLYSAAKYGLRGFALALRRQLRRSGVSVSVVSPGYIRTPLTSYRRGRLPGPGIIARAVASVIERPRREVIAPWWYRLAVAVETVAPGLVDLALGRRPAITARHDASAERTRTQR